MRLSDVRGNPISLCFSPRGEAKCMRGPLVGRNRAFMVIHESRSTAIKRNFFLACCFAVKC